MLAYRANHPVTAYPNVPRPAAGTLHELAVSMDLIERGYAVYRALAPHAPCDLLVWQPDSRPCRIEVTTGCLRANGAVTFPKGEGDADKSDLIAVVIPVAPRMIAYFPTFRLIVPTGTRHLTLDDAVTPDVILGQPCSI